MGKLYRAPSEAHSYNLQAKQPNLPLKHASLIQQREHSASYGTDTLVLDVLF